MTLLKVQKKPIRIEAVQYTGHNADDIFEFCSKAKWGIGQLSIYIESLAGDIRIDEGDYVLEGVEGEFYPCKPSIFEKTYDVIDVKFFKKKS